MNYLLIYRHRHGEDLTPHTTEGSAFVGACFTIIEYWDEIDDADVRREIKQHLQKVHGPGFTTELANYIREQVPWSRVVKLGGKL